MNTKPSLSENANASKVYLVTLVDTTDGASYYRMVRATSGYKAGVYALKFDGEGNPQSIDGYQVVTVLSLKRVQEILRAMETFTATDIGEVDDSDVDIPYDAVISP